MVSFLNGDQIEYIENRVLANEDLERKIGEL